ncbi:MAG: Uma2 family endonuclease, partial [Anaerolineae bacterium]|nr:Uma2 family endonuclease [Anaerolineae bacterium]MDW8173810.1 Uma2 family endonuclease [Anaerolineae bacterium]
MVLVMPQARLSAEEFEALAQQPQYADARLEFIAGEVYEVPSNNLASHVAANILIEIGLYLKQNPIGWLTGADGGYRVGTDRYIPDLAYNSYARQAAIPDQGGYNPVPPDLVVEVIPDVDNRKEADMLRLKLSSYLAQGTTVWVIVPQERRVEVHAPGRNSLALSEQDTLDGGAVLPGFRVAVK